MGILNFFDKRVFIERGFQVFNIGVTLIVQHLNGGLVHTFQQ